MPSNFSNRASGNISPSRFVTVATASAFYVEQATGAAVEIVGISQEGTRYAGGSLGDDGYAATTGVQIMVYDDPNEDECLLLLGSAVTAGDLLTSDSSGRGIPVTATGQWFGAQAKQTQASGALARVRPRFGING